MFRFRLHQSIATNQGDHRKGAESVDLPITERATVGLSPPISVILRRHA